MITYETAPEGTYCASYIHAIFEIPADFVIPTKEGDVLACSACVALYGRLRERN